MIFLKSNKGRLKLSDKSLKILQSYIQDDSAKKEAGGVLLGRYIIDTKDIIIDTISTPYPTDESSRYGFVRNIDGHQEMIKEYWNKYNGKCHFIGEWHTHPEEYPSPSSQDRKNWREIIKRGEFSSFYLYFIIVGTREIRVWEGNRKSKRFKRLRHE